MKSILGILSFITILFGVFIVSDFYKKIELDYMINHNQSTINIYPPDKYETTQAQSVKDLIAISNKHQVSVTKRIQINQHKILIFTNRPYLLAQQVKNNHIKLADKSIVVKVYPLSRLKNYSSVGSFYIDSNDKNNKQAVIEDLNRKVGNVTEEKSEFNLKYYWNYRLISIFLFLIVITLALFIYLLQVNAYKFKLKFNLGYTPFEIIRTVLKENLSILILFCVIVIFSQSLIIYYVLELRNILLPILITGVMFTFIGCLMISLLILYLHNTYLTMYSKMNRIKFNNAHHYLFIVVGLIAIFLISHVLHDLIENEKHLKREHQNIAAWEQARNTYRMVVQSNGIHLDEKLHDDVSERMKAYYNSEYFKGFILEAENYTEALEGGPFYKKNVKKDSRFEPVGESIVVDKNYVQENFSKSIFNQMKFDKIHLNLIIPMKYKTHINEIVSNYKESSYTYDPVLEDYNKKVKINPIFIENNRKYFTYESDLVEPDYSVKDPIIVVDTGNSIALNYMHYLTGFYYLKSNLDNPIQALEEGLNQFNLKPYMYIMESVYDEKADQIRDYHLKRFENMFSIIGLVIGSLILIYTYIGVYLNKSTYTFVIKMNLGYTRFQIHQTFIWVLALLNVLFILLLSLQYTLMSLSYGITMICIQILLVLYRFNSLNKALLNSVIKGESYD
ncbi:bacteriocin-associated protein [Staphylococcus massiliensis]|uniref:bacteriocin-associated protein n=1 Tax=Staphylococcus massiliensis TaxID=555791 RepID=UPI001EE15379|nr:bacteriocin-associated protein [Staphylococcus massiliensis]MCG3411873.1 bacteriocin-associated protein [Staphylococcus massiliensis]